MTTTQTQAAHVQSAPRTTAFPPEQFGRGKKRTIEYEWTVRDTDKGRIVVVLYCYHVPGRYVATVQQRTYYDGGSFEWLPHTDHSLTKDAVKRYSTTTLTAFAEKALEMFREITTCGQCESHLRGDHV